MIEEIITQPCWSQWCSHGFMCEISSYEMSWHERGAQGSFVNNYVVRALSIFQVYDVLTRKR